MVEKYLNAFSICSYVLFFLAILIEYLISYKNNLNDYEKNDSFFNIGTGLFYLIFPVILGTSLTIFLYEILSKFAFFEMPGVWSALIRGEKLYWWAFLILIFTDDFCYYWFHRISHVSRFLWCIHEVHHSSKKYNFTVFLRASFLDYVPQGLFYIPLFLLGFKLEDIFFQMAINFTYQFWLHTKYTGRIYLLDYIFNTASHHRVHHAKNIQYLDKNYGGIFIIWDILFKTFEREKEKVEYGVLHDLNTDNVFKLNFETFKMMFRDINKAKGIKNKFLYFIYVPGWSHDGSSKTTKQLQKEYYNSKI
jgi:sterol desaturase/sphingolipid hydroxylase (fatty acid hydroxylase superfamily)